MSVKSVALVAAMSLAALASGTAAQASALTGSLTASYLYPNSVTTYATTTLTVGSPISCPGADPICTPFVRPATISASGLSITLAELGGSGYGSALFNGMSFSGLTFNDGSSVTGFSLDTDLAGLTAADIAFGSHSISFNAQGLAFPTDYHVRLNLITSSAVPEPLTLSLFGAGLAGAAVMRRRKKASA